MGEGVDRIVRDKGTAVPEGPAEDTEGFNPSLSESSEWAESEERNSCEMTKQKI